MTIETYLLYLAALGVFFATPPDTSQLLIIANSARHGLKRSVWTIAGDLSANAIQMSAAAFGIAAVIAASAGAFQVVKWLGVAYLAWIGFRLFFSKSGGPGAAAPGAGLRAQALPPGLHHFERQSVRGDVLRGAVSAVHRSGGVDARAAHDSRRDLSARRRPSPARLGLAGRKRRGAPSSTRVRFHQPRLRRADARRGRAAGGQGPRGARAPLSGFAGTVSHACAEPRRGEAARSGAATGFPRGVDAFFLSASRASAAFGNPDCTRRGCALKRSRPPRCRGGPHRT